MFLEQIIEVKRKEIESLAERLPSDPGESGKVLPPCRSLSAALRRKPGPALIAEVKPASPSRGTIRNGVDPAVTAAGYEAGGARAVSVLTDASFFGGSIRFLPQVKEAVGIPVLRKDFIIDPLQVVESRLKGADAILLIAAVLKEEELIELTRLARASGMEVLIEVHREEEIPRALAAEPDVLGINNRDLHSFDTDLSVTERLRPLIPDGIPLIGESGIQSPADVGRMVRAGVDGVLVGEYLMRQPSPEAGVRELLRGAVPCSERA